ncbi:MAG: hypothetical protein IKF58_00915 [Bacillus sp. (in: Bacteria)]|nr:hypothetical protein [Bacillus sp. (in: firmicutes)]
MDEALKMMAEYILEENVSQKTEIRSLKEELEREKRDNKWYVDKLTIYIKEQNDLKNAIEKDIRWKDGKPNYVSIYDDKALQVICDILSIYEHDKAIL